MTNIEEIYKNVVGYEGKYEVSSFGNIKALAYTQICGNPKNNKKSPILRHEKILRPVMGNTGYLKIGLTINGKLKIISVHRIVAIAFHENKEQKPYVNHKDGNRLNNYAYNLEWCTAQENTRHYYDVLNGTPPNKGKLNSTNPKKIFQFNKYTNELIAEHNSSADAARSLGLTFDNSRNINACARGYKGQKTAYGYKWARV